MSKLFHPILIAATLAFASAPQAQDFPVTIEHGYGGTTIPAEPQRIVTGGGESGALRWDRDAVAALGGEFPTILAAGSDVPVEAVAALQPDLIIAVYSGLAEDEYGILSGRRW